MKKRNNWNKSIECQLGVWHTSPQVWTGFKPWNQTNGGKICQLAPATSALLEVLLLRNLNQNAPEGNKTDLQRLGSTAEGWRRSAGARQLLGWNPAKRTVRGCSRNTSALASERINFHVSRREHEVQMWPNGASQCPHHLFLITLLKFNFGKMDAAAPRELTVSPSGRNHPGKPLGIYVQFALKDLLPLVGFQRMEDVWWDLEGADLRLLACWHLNKIYQQDQL